MNLWTSDGTVNINNFNNYVDTVVNEIHDIIYDLLKNKANTAELRKALLDIDSFSNIYDQYNYNQEYKPFIYYGLRKYSVLTNFYLPEVQINNQINATSPFEAATNVILEIDDLGFKNITKNRGFDLLVHLAAIDTAHKYIIEKTAQDINVTEKTELNIIIDELIKDDKNLFVKYKDIYIKYFQFLTQDRVELFNDIYKTNPEGFVKFLNYVFEAEFFKEDIYFLRKDNKLYVINERGIQKEINDEFVKVNINLLPENVYIPSPYFYVYLNLNAELFTIFERLLFTFINDNNVYPIVINATTYNLTPQEMLQVFILTVYKNIIETLYGIKPVFKKVNNFNTSLIDLYNAIKNNTENTINDCFSVFNNCILTKLCFENYNSNTYFAGKFNRKIAGIIQIIVNSSSDVLVDIYNLATIDDAKNIAFYLINLFNYLCDEDVNINYFNRYNKSTIQQLATYLIDLPYRMILYLTIQKISLQKNYFIYSEDKHFYKLLLRIEDYYYNILINDINIDCISKNSVQIITNNNLKVINLNNNYSLVSKNLSIERNLNYYCNSFNSNISFIVNNEFNQHTTNNIINTYTINNLPTITFYSLQDYTIKTENLLQLCNLCTVHKTFINTTYVNNCYDSYSIENKISNTKMYVKNDVIQQDSYNMNNLINCNNSINLVNKFISTKIYIQNDL